MLDAYEWRFEGCIPAGTGNAAFTMGPDSAEPIGKWARRGPEPSGQTQIVNGSVMAA